MPSMFYASLQIDFAKPNLKFVSQRMHVYVSGSFTSRVPQAAVSKYRNYKRNTAYPHTTVRVLLYTSTRFLCSSQGADYSKRRYSGAGVEISLKFLLACHSPNVHLSSSFSSKGMEGRLLTDP